MIDKAIIFGVRRANIEIPHTEILQMVGRCGRSYTKAGHAYIIAPSTDADYAEKCLFGTPPPIESRFSDLDELVFHVIPEIDKGNVMDEESFHRWFSRSLAGFQGKTVKWADVVEALKTFECVEHGNRLTRLGKLSSRMYFHPAYLSAMKSRLERIETLDSIGISCAIAGRRYSIEEDENEPYQEYCSATASILDSDETPEGYAAWCLLERQPDRAFRQVAADMSNDIQRRLNAMIEMCGIVGRTPPKDVLECLNARIPYSLNRFRKMFPDAPAALIREMALLHVEENGIDDIKRNASDRLVAYLEKRNND